MAEDPCLPASGAAHAGGSPPAHHHAHHVIGRIRHRIRATASHSQAHPGAQSAACGRPELAADGGLPAMPAGRGLSRTVAASGKLAGAAKAGALLAAAGLAGAGAATLSGMTPQSAMTTHVVGAPSDPGVPPSLTAPGRPLEQGGGRVQVPEPSSGGLVAAASACVLGARWLSRRKAG